MADEEVGRACGEVSEGGYGCASVDGGLRCDGEGGCVFVAVEEPTVEDVDVEGGCMGKLGELDWAELATFRTVGMGSDEFVCSEG